MNYKEHKFKYLGVMLLLIASILGLSYMYATNVMQQPTGENPDTSLLSVEQVESPDNRSVLSFENLTDEQQQEFQKALNASDQTAELPDPVELESIDNDRFYIEYEGTLYRFSFPVG
ncbi:hypothetical protein [Haloarchaeobius salinus]|uniref:hypothetical protein n=1 Tax=Haloarchaeobius salinus TaxID=1198298 RepID=UPI002109B274|nr:hypothetical protein [Haloarchaeobius salinus]